MNIYADHNEALAALAQFAMTHPEECPEAIADQISALVQTFSAELPKWGALLLAVYAAPRGVGDADTVGPLLMQIVAGNLGVFAANGWLDIGQSGYAAKMRLALLRDAGEEAPEGMSWPEPGDDPVTTPPILPPPPPIVEPPYIPPPPIPPQP